MNLIVGGTGFIGGHLAEYFFGEGEISKGIFRKGSHLRILDQCGVQCVEADLLDRKTLHEPLDLVNVVYNLASPTPKDGDQDFMDVNTNGLRNLLEEAEKHGVKKFVHLSTLDVYGFRRGKNVSADTSQFPDHPYQRAKLEAEKLLQDFAKKGTEMKVKIVRAARATGARDTTLALPILRMISDEKVVLPPGCDSAMSFTHPKDIAQALFRAASKDEKGGLYLVKSFDATLEELVARILEGCGKRLSVKREGLLSKAHLPAYTTIQIRAGLSIEKQESWAAISYSPTYDVKKTGSEIAEWYRKKPWIVESGPA